MAGCCAQQHANAGHMSHLAGNVWLQLLRQKKPEILQGCPEGTASKSCLLLVSLPPPALCSRETAWFLLAMKKHLSQQRFW